MTAFLRAIIFALVATLLGVLLAGPASAAKIDDRGAQIRFVIDERCKSG
eukprot:gene67320-92215_t